jgi:ribosomal protein L11 methyltransferase
LNFSVRVPRERASAIRVLDALTAEGAEAVEEEADAIWALFRGLDPERVAQRLAKALGGPVEVAPEQLLDWETTWSRRLAPVDVGGLQIAPWGARGPARPDALVLEIGGAFGTGVHATTRLCLDSLVERPPRGRLLDVGTGTGVLALAGLRLGADQAWGTDLDAEALAVAARNAARHGLAERCTFSQGSVPPRQRFDRVLANLVTGPLQALADDLARAVAPGGELVVSGYPASQQALVGRWFRATGLRGFVSGEREGWGASVWLAGG